MDKNSILKGIADNQALLDAVKGVIESKFSLDVLTTSLTNEQIGQIVRARLDGLKAVKEAFKEIEKYKTQEEKQPVVNRAR